MTIASRRARVRAHSFDVFDTCLVRTWARPIDVLYDAAERVLAGSAAQRGHAEVVSEVVRQRQVAEAAQMERLGVEAVGIEHIYADEDGAFRALGVDPAAMLIAELEAERAAIRPVRAGLDRVRAARAAGLRVLFVSDMYLPAGEIRDKLEEFGFAEPGDSLYVSGELGISKWSGRLFEHVLREERLEPGELVHCGDNPVTDDASPARLGIAVRPLATGKPTRFEVGVVEEPAASRSVASRLGGLSRAARVAVGPERGPLADAAAIAGDVVAPLFCSFVAWVLLTARAEGLERLYFVSRDAQILLAVANELRRDGDPECRYLYGSRQAWFLPGVDAVDRESLAWITEPKESLKTPRTLLAKLELTPEALSGTIEGHGLGFDERLNGPTLDRFWAVLDEAADLVLRHAAEARDRTRRYFAQEGLCDPGRWALVDLGWRLSAQRALRRVLTPDGGADDVLGLYLALRRNRVSFTQAGAYRAFVLQDDASGPEAPEAPPGDWLFANMSFVEQVFSMADHGSCTGYRDAGDGVEPILRDMAPDPARDAYVGTLHRTVLAFAREAAGSGLLDEHLDEVRALALAGGKLAVERPTRREAAALGALRVGDDQNETRTRPLAGPLGPRDLALMVGSRLGAPVTRDFGTDWLWREGSLALSAPPVRGLYRAMRSGEEVARQTRAAVRRSAGVRVRAAAGAARRRFRRSSDRRDEPSPPRTDR